MSKELTKSVPNFGFANFLTALYDDPLRPETARRGRWLVALSIAAFLVSVFGAKFKADSVVPVDITQSADAIPGAIAFVVLLLWVEFALRALTDLLHQREVGVAIAKFLAAERLDRLHRRAKEIDAEEPDSNQDYDGEPDPWWADYLSADAEARRKFARMDETLGERVLPRWTKLARVSLEVATPLVLGALTLWVSAPALSAFASRIALAM